MNALLHGTSFSRHRRRVLLLLPLGFAASGLIPADANASSAPGGFFERNEGQAGKLVRYVWRGNGNVAAMLDQKVVMRHRTSGAANGVATATVFFQGGRSGEWVAEHKLHGASHYLLGGHRRSVTNVASFERVHQKGVYRGIDVEWYGSEDGRLEFDVVVNPGADPAQVTLATPAWGARIDSSGNLLATADRALVLRRPVAYQVIQGKRRDVPAAFVLTATDRVKLKLGAYDSEAALRIDPVISYSTYLGGSGGDFATKVTVDKNGYAYVTGITFSVDFPIGDPLEPDLSGLFDGFVTKLSPNGKTIVYSTYLGGSNLDSPGALAVNDDGSLYVAGNTDSPDFPTVNAIQTKLTGVSSAFIAKLAPSGSRFHFSSYFGGTFTNTGAPNAGTSISSIVLDRNRGGVAVVGVTSATDFPVKRAVRPNYGGGTLDVFVARFLGSGVVTFSSFLGGSEIEEAMAVDLDSKGNIVITGETSSYDFPTTAGVFQPNYPNTPSFSSKGFSGFVAKISSSGAKLVFGTFLGGSQLVGRRFPPEPGSDFPSSVSVSPSGTIWISGVARSGDYPVTPDALQKFHHAANIGSPSSVQMMDGFVTHLSGEGRKLIYSTYLGGNDYDQAMTIRAFRGGAAIAGSTSSTNFPKLNGLNRKVSVTEGFLTVLCTKQPRLALSTLFGGNADDNVFDMALDSAANNAYLVGGTKSTNLAKSGAVQPRRNGPDDAFVLKMRIATGAAPLCPQG